jgi:O-antigen/teichoic acid export membrane protein
MHDRSRQAGILTSAEFIRFGIKSLIGIALARILIPADLGTYRQLFLLYTTFSTVLLLGIPHSVLYFLPRLRHIDSRREYISRIVNLITWLSFAFGLALLLFRGVIARAFNNPDLGQLLILYAVYPLFMFITQIYSSVNLGLKKPEKTAVFTLFCIASDLVLILGLALLTRSLSWIVMGVMLSALVQWAFARWQLSGWLTKVTFDPEFYRDQFRYSLPLGLSSIIGMLSVQLDKFVISGFFRPEDFAVFSIGAMELPFISILTNSVNAILLPHISESRDTLAEIYKGAARKNALIILPLAVLFFVYAQPIITILYSSRYLASVPYFQVYLLILPLRIASPGILMMALGKTKYIMQNSILTLGSNLVLNLVLVRVMGMMGAAVATVIVTWISVGVYLYWIRYRLHLHIPDLLPLKQLLKTALCVLAAGFAAWLALKVGNYGWIAYLLALPVFLGVFGGVGIVLNAILPYDLQLVKAMASKAYARISKM